MASIEDKSVLQSYIKTRKEKEKNETIYINNYVLKNKSIINDIKGAHRLSKNIKGIRPLKKGSNHHMIPEVREHFLDSSLLSYYFSQLPKEKQKPEWRQVNFKSANIIIFDFEKARDENNMKLLSKGYLIKVISKPIFTKNKNYSFIFESSQKNGCIIFVYKKINGTWVEIESITTCV